MYFRLRGNVIFIYHPFHDIPPSLTLRGMNDNYRASYNALLYAPVIRNLGVMNQMLISKYLDYGMIATARDLQKIDTMLIRLIKGYNPDQPCDEDGRWTSEGADDEPADSSGLAPYIMGSRTIR
jgi:hypothetical protein